MVVMIVQYCECSFFFNFNLIFLFCFVFFTPNIPGPETEKEVPLLHVWLGKEEEEM